MMILLAAAMLADCPPTDPTGVIRPDGPNYTVGKVEPGWCMAGVDLFARVGPDARAPMQLLVGFPAGRSVERLQTGLFAAPAHWQKMGMVARNALANGALADILFQFHGKRVVTVTRNPAWRVGNAVCVTESGPIDVYLVGKAPPDAEDREMIDQQVNGAWRKAVPSTICYNAIPASDGHYRLRFHNVRGAVADDVNEAYADSPAKFLPARDIERYRPSPIDSGNPDRHRL
jgi:hypothetical protein